MSTNLSPKAIKELVETLTGLNAIGVVEKQSHLQGEVYKINVNNGFLICIWNENGWVVSLFNKDNKISGAWQNTPTPLTQIGIQIIDIFINKNGKSVNPVFEKTYMDAPNDIERKTYTSDIGAITIHTRKHPLGTEGIIEVASQRLILRYIWERSTGGIDTTQIQQLSSLPF